ncbi:portal protein [Bacillus phage vB_BsuM-Goe10]|nr:portal protein [Bacillus phage vB_BsuM-Goe10]
MDLFESLSKAMGLKQEIKQEPQFSGDSLEKSERAQGAKSIIEDPLALSQNNGYKEKPQSLDFDTLRRMSVRNTVVGAIIQTRVNQVSTFSQPARYTKDGVGFEIKLRDPKATPTPEQRQRALAIENFIENCGYDYNPGRDNFDTLLRKIVRDSLTFDQLTFEIVEDRLGRPAEVHAVDASTVRAAEVEANNGEDYIHPTDIEDEDGIKWVQIVNGQVVAEFTGSQLAFGVRNPRTDLSIQPYGLSELEILVKQITSHLWAEDYNSRYFSQGGTTKGILNMKGQNVSRTQLDAFRRQWTAQLSGTTGSWKTPVVSVEGLEYINVSQSNREMEYEMWMNYLINICCAVYQIDPSEVNFPNRGGAGGTSGGGLGDGGIEDRLKNSRDKGLRPLLRFIESIINRYIIRRFSDEFTFNFVGLNGETEQERLEISNKQVRAFKTINEVRKENDLPPIEDGDIVLDQTYANYIIQKKQLAQTQEELEDQQVDEDSDTDVVSDGLDDRYDQ